MSTLKVGLIGFGKWVRQAYLPVLTEMSGAQVVAVSAASEQSRADARQALGDHVRLYDGYQRLLHDEDVQAVMIALPNELHADAIEAAAAAGKHIFIEPPLGLDDAQISRALTAIEAAQTQGVVVRADHELRYVPVVTAAMRLVDQGRIGRPRMARVRLWCNWALDGNEDFKAYRPQGFFMWLGCWYLDLIDCVFAAEVRRADVAGGYASNGRLMDHGWAALSFEHGLGLFEFNLTATAGTDIRFAIAASDGEVEADLLTGEYRWRNRDGQWQTAKAPGSLPVHGFVGMRESIIAFADAVGDGSGRAGTTPPPDLEVCRRVNQAAAACTAAERANT